MEITLTRFAWIEETDAEAVAPFADSKKRSSRSFYPKLGKRALDLVLSIIAAPLALAIVVVVAVLMFLSGDRGPVLFGHKRVGKDAEEFRCWKIRSMVTNAQEKLQAHLEANPDAAAEWKRDHKLENDPRITRFGQFLRKTSLDEVPQLWNVIKGDMSLVGPRPIVEAEVEKYGVYQRDYFSVRPGVTGLWQISGRNDISYDERVALDVKYTKIVSFKVDVKAIIATVSAVLNTTGK